MKSAVWVSLNSFTYARAYGIAIVILIRIQKIVWMLQNAFVVASGESLVDSIARTSQFTACSCHKLMHALTDIRIWSRGYQMIVITH